MPRLRTLCYGSLQIVDFGLGPIWLWASKAQSKDEQLTWHEHHRPYGEGAYTRINFSTFSTPNQSWNFKTEDVFYLDTVF